MRQLISLFLLILVIQTFLTVHLNAVYGSNSIVDKQKAHSDDVVPNVIIIKFSEYQTINENTISTQNPVLDNRLKDAGILSLKSIFSRQPSRLKKSITTELSNIYMAHFQGKKTPWEVSELISSWPEIVYAEPKYLHYIVETIPNDTLYENNQSAYYEVIEAPKAWDRVKGEQGEAIIAIVDGGTEIGHIDLSDNIWQNQVEVDGEIGVDDDDNGFIDDLYGWNFPNQSGDPTGLPNTSNADHGTHVAGIACAVTNNITGVAGTSWNATLMGINASDENSDRVIAYGIEGILYAAENGADIINCSWGRQGGYSYYEQEIINHATSLGAVVIAAAGNNNSDLSFYPASYANVLSVAGTDVDDNRYWDSNYGPNVDLAAPGVNIFSTFSDNTYGYSTGTSMSSPVVAGSGGIW